VGATFAHRRGVNDLDIGAAFDLIVGTSTGGIIGCALAKGVPLMEVVELYRLHGQEIFRRRLPASVPGTVIDQFKRSAALAEGDRALRAALSKVLGATTIRDIYEERGIALCIPAVEMSQHHAWVFKTPHFAGTNHRDDLTTLIDACLATSAAPIFRSMAAVEHTGTAEKGYNVFVDGGLWANNPVLIGLIEALDIAAPGQTIEIFCLGTCPMPSGEQIARTNLHRGLADWKFGGDAAALSIDAQQFAYDHMAKKLAKHCSRPCSIVRFPSDKVPAALIPYLGLDDTRPEAIAALINQARTDADMTNSRCAYRQTDPAAECICQLFESVPTRTDPLTKRTVPLFNGPTPSNR
jgi:hypothetical protein